MISQEMTKYQNLYYMGDVFKKDIFSSETKQFREHGIEIVSKPSIKSFLLSMELLIKYLNLIIKKDYIFVFTDPSIKKNSKFILDQKKNTSNISKYINSFKKFNSSISYEVNLEKNFFSRNYHKNIFFYVYSNKSKKILAQGGGYSYKNKIIKLDGFGFSCNIDYWVELF